MVAILTAPVISTWRLQTLYRVKLESGTPPRFSLAKRDAGGRAGGLAACVQAWTLSLRFSQRRLHNDWLNRTGLIRAASATGNVSGKGSSRPTPMSPSHQRPFNRSQHVDSSGCYECRHNGAHIERRFIDKEVARESASFRTLAHQIVSPCSEI